MIETIECSFLTEYAEDLIHRIHHHERKVQNALNMTAPPLTDSQWRDLMFEILDDLTQRLRIQAQEAMVQGGIFGDQQYHTLQYALTSYADEIFLQREWPGRKLWEDHLLEMSFFKTHQAGERFFQNIDQLIQQGNQVSQEMTRLYFWILSLGFKGQYTHAEDQNLEEYRTKLHRLLNPKPQSLEKTPLFPDAYQHRIDRGDRVMMPDPGFWKFVYGSFVITLLMISTYAWISISTPLRTAIAPLFAMMEGI